MALSKQLDALEQRLHNLLGAMEQLAAENRELRQQEQKLQAECIELRKKNTAASSKLEAILNDLKQQLNQQEG